MSNARDPTQADRWTGEKLVRIKVADYDPNAKVPVVFGDPDGDVLVAEGDLALLVGEVGSGKSATAADAALAAAFGQSLFDFPCPKARKVMLVLADGDGEMPTRRRLYRLGAGRDLTPEQIDGCERFVLFVPCGFSLDNAADFNELQRAITHFDPDLICIETLASLMGPDRDSGDQGDAADFMNKRLRPLQRRTWDSVTWEDEDEEKMAALVKQGPPPPRTMLVGAHFNKLRSGKAGKRLKDRVATSYYTLGAADAAIGLDAVAEERFVVRMVKRSRWGCSYPAFLVIIKGQKDEPMTLFRAGPVREDDEPKARRKPDTEVAVKVITEARAKVPDLTRKAAVKLMVAAKVKRSTAYRACDEAGLA